MRDTLIPTEVVDCIANTRTPGREELLRVASRIRSEIGGGVRASDRVAASDDQLSSRALRVAEAALLGAGQPRAWRCASEARET